MATTAIDSLRGILNGFRDLNSKGIYTMNGTETDLLRQILIEVQALSLGNIPADGSVTTAKIVDDNVTEAKLSSAFKRSLFNKNYFKNPNFQVIQGTASGTLANSTALPTASLGYLGETEWFMCAAGATPAYAFSASGESVTFTGAASTTGIVFGQRIESRDMVTLANRLANMTLSVELSNSLVTSIIWEVFRPTTSNDVHGTVGTPTQTLIASGTFTVTSTLTRYSATFTLPALASRGVEVRLRALNQTSGTWVIARPQLEEGNTATNFICNDFATELIRCQRYFYALPATNSRFPCPSTGGFGVTYTYPFKVTMFDTPVISPTYTGAFNVTSYGTPQVTSEGFSLPVTGTNFTNTSWTVSASCSAHIP